MIDRTGQSLDMAGDSSSESEIDADTRRDMIDPRAQDTSAHVHNSSESDLDIDLDDCDLDIDPNDNLATDAPTTQRVQTKGLAREKLRQKKHKQKVLKIVGGSCFMSHLQQGHGHRTIEPGTIARSVAMSVGNQEAP